MNECRLLLLWLLAGRNFFLFGQETDAHIGHNDLNHKVGKSIDLLTDATGS